MSSSNALVELSHQGVISVIGSDAGKFLQGQVTCDITELTETSRLGMHCNHKGRALFSFRAIQLTNDHIALRMPLEMRETAKQALGKYIVFSKAELHDRSHQFKRLGIAGTDAESLLTTHLTRPPQSTQAVSHLDEGCLIKLSDNRYECWLPDEQADALKAELAENTTIEDANYWTLLDIRDGIGEIYPSSAELFIPQMLNYQVLGGISFDKGCYTGQEIVARMQYLGKLKRQMYRARLEIATEVPRPGDDIYTEGSQQSVGNIVSVALTDPGNTSAEALIVLTKEVAEANSVFLDPACTRKLTLLSLPYGFAETEA